MRCALVLALMFTIATCVVAIVSIAIPYWQYGSSPDEKYQGLWISCNQRKNNCEMILMAPEYLDATRVMMLFGMSFYLISVLLTLAYMTVKKENGNLINGAIVMTALGGVWCMIAIIVYGAKYTFLLDSQGTSLHAGFGLAVCATIMGFICPLMFCMAKARGEVD